MWICFHGYGARELYLVFAHNNSYEIKLAVAVTPTISSAPSTRFQRHKWMRWFTCIWLPEPQFYSLTKHVNTNQKIDQFQIMPHTVSRTEKSSKVWTPITGAGGIHQCSQEHTTLYVQVPSVCLMVVAIGSVPCGLKWKKQHIMTQEKAKCGPKYHNNLVKSSFWMHERVTSCKCPYCTCPNCDSWKSSLQCSILSIVPPFFSLQLLCHASEATNSHSKIQW